MSDLSECAVKLVDIISVDRSIQDIHLIMFQSHNIEDNIEALDLPQLVSPGQKVSPPSLSQVTLASTWERETSWLSFVHFYKKTDMEMDPP
jgi:hypothetical protein